MTFFRPLIALSCVFVSVTVLAIGAKTATVDANTRAVDAVQHLEMIPRSVLQAADTQAVAGWMGPVEKGVALGCYKNDASLLRGWIPAKFEIHPDFTIAISPRAPVSSDRSAGDGHLYDAVGKALIAGCEARDAVSR